MQQIIEAEEIEKEKARKVQEEEEEKRRLEEEGINPHDLKEESKKESVKVEKPGPASEKIGPKPPSIANIDDEVKLTLHKEWSALAHNFKD